MAQNSPTHAKANAPVKNGDQSQDASKKARENASGLNNPTQVEQDNRIDKAKADARAAGGGPNKPEGGLNQDG